MIYFYNMLYSYFILKLVIIISSNTQQLNLTDLISNIILIASYYSCPRHQKYLIIIFTWCTAVSTVYSSSSSYFYMG